MNEQESTPKYRRRQFWINKKFQRRMIGHFILVTISSIILSHVITLGFLKIRELFGVAPADMIYLQNALTETVAFGKTIEMLWLPLLSSSLIGSLVILLFGLFYSHRLAGPLFNLKRTMSKVARGKWDVSVGIRKNDEFHDVKESLNGLVTSLQERMSKLDEVLKNVPEKQRSQIKQIFQESKDNN